MANGNKSTYTALKTKSNTGNESAVECAADEIELSNSNPEDVSPSNSLEMPMPATTTTRTQTRTRTQSNTKTTSQSLRDEAVSSLRLFLDAKLNILFIFGPIAFLGSSLSIIPEAPCFLLAGLALIPCAERLSFVTEQVAEHTNDTFGALLNATFGNAPEFLISAAALRSGYFRVVQLTLLGSMVMNLLFVFGLSCLVGGLQWQVQELRISSGNVSIGMLLMSTMGLVLPAALKLGNEANNWNGNGNENETRNHVDQSSMSSSPSAFDSITPADVNFSRVNALVMVTGYVLYLVFQLGSHKDEFDYDGDEYAAFGGGHNIVRTPQLGQPNTHQAKKPVARRNKFCGRYCFVMRYCPKISERERSNDIDIDIEQQQPLSINHNMDHDDAHIRTFSHPMNHEIIEMQSNSNKARVSALKRTVAGASALAAPQSQLITTSPLSRSMSTDQSTGATSVSVSLEDDPCSKGKDSFHVNPLIGSRLKKSLSDRGDDVQEDEDIYFPDEIMSMKMGLVWLGFVTAAISILSDIIVETIDGFAAHSSMSEVFTSVIIIPYFSNIAEQVSAVIFAYKNKMDLCIGVTVGSAIQIGQFVMPGCVLVGWIMDKNMTLYFRGYETICLLLGVLCVAAVLQGGTTNWLVGVFFVGVYTMIAAGFAFHEIEDLADGGGADSNVDTPS